MIPTYTHTPYDCRTIIQHVHHPSILCFQYTVHSTLVRQEQYFESPTVSPHSEAVHTVADWTTAKRADTIFMCMKAAKRVHNGYRLDCTYCLCQTGSDSVTRTDDTDGVPYMRDVRHGLTDRRRAGVKVWADSGAIRNPPINFEPTGEQNDGWTDTSA